MTKYRKYKDPYNIDVLRRYSIYSQGSSKRESRGLTQGSEISVTIEDIDSDGRGCAHYRGYRVTIPRAVPGERVRVRIVKVKGKEALATVIERLEEPRR